MTSSGTLKSILLQKLLKQLIITQKKAKTNGFYGC